MDRLVLGVVGVAEGDIGQLVEAQLPVGLGIGDLLMQVGALQHLVVAVMLHRDRQADLERAHPHVDARQHGAEVFAPFGHRGLRVLHLLELFCNPARPDRVVIIHQLAMLGAAGNRRSDALGRQHAALHRGVAALDPRDIDEARGAADERAAGEGQLGDRLPAALVDDAAAIGDALAALEDRRDRRMVLPALEFLVGRDIGVLVIERGDEAERDLAIGLVVEEPAAPGAALAQRPALRMDHAAGLVLGGIDIPQFLDAEAVDLRLAIGLEVVFRLHLLGQVAARTLGEERVFRVNFHPRLVIALLRAILGDAHVLRYHAGNRTLLVEQHFCSGEAGEDHHAQALGLFAQPARQIAQRTGVIAVIAHEGGKKEFGQVGLAGFGQHPVVVLGHRGFRHRAVHVAPFGQQFVQCPGVDHGARQDVRTDFAALLEHHDLEVLVDLLQPDCRCQAGDAAADDDDVAGHRFAFAHDSLFSSRNL